METHDTPPAAAAAEPFGPDSKVADVIEAHPEALEVLLGMGFDGLKNPVARKTVARFCSIAQAAQLHAIPIERVMGALRQATGLEPRTAEASKPAHDDDAIPELEGDVRVLGLVPCPLRGTLTDRFDAFATHLGATKGVRVGWWLGGETGGSVDVHAWLDGVMRAGEHERVADVVFGVGSDLFFDEHQYGGLPAGAGFGKFPHPFEKRKDLGMFEDPRGLLALQYVVGFTFTVRQNRLPSGCMPRTWADLAMPELEGLIGIPSLDLPTVPDLMAAIEAHIGPDRFAQFAANIRVAMHPAQAAPRTQIDSVPPVMIIPREFARGAQTGGAFEVIPDDGIIGIGAYVAKRADAPPEAQKVVDFLFSHEFLEPIWTHGMLYPNSADVPVRLARRIIARPWSGLLDGDPEAESARLLSMIHFARNE